MPISRPKSRIKIPMKNKASIIGVFLVGLVTASTWLWLHAGAPEAPDAVFTTITGKTISLKEQRGKPVIVTFWATDCLPCMKEIPHLIDLYDNYHDQGLEIIAVAMFYDPPNQVVAMSKTKQLPYDIALDIQAIHARQFGDIRLTPATFLISPESTLDLYKLGAFDVADMKSRIEKMLRG